MAIFRLNFWHFEKRRELTSFREGASQQDFSCRGRYVERLCHSQVRRDDTINELGIFIMIKVESGHGQHGGVGGCLYWDGCSIACKEGRKCLTELIQNVSIQQSKKYEPLCSGWYDKWIRVARRRRAGQYLLWMGTRYWLEEYESMDLESAQANRSKTQRRKSA